MMEKKKKATLLLDDGTLFTGYAFGGKSTRAGEIIFNTGMVGYQEIIYDPSYAGQIVVMTYPEIGNYGTNSLDRESRRPFLEGFVVRKFNPTASNWRSEKSLGELLEEWEVPGIEGVDTRALTLHIREKGAMNAVIDTTGKSLEELKEILEKTPPMEGRDLVRHVTTETPYRWEDVSTGLREDRDAPPGRFRVVAYDFGIKWNILRLMRKKGIEVEVLPAETPAEEIIERNPDGVFLSNGPGDPAAVSYAVENVKKLLGRVPVFGICLGHQILSLAAGMSTYKLKFGHHGINHPVRDERTGRIKITSQNHGFAVKLEDVKKTGGILTHINLNDHTVEGVYLPDARAYSVQYHPEAAPGPHDSLDIFDEFIQLMEGKL